MSRLKGYKQIDGTFVDKNGRVIDSISAEKLREIYERVEGLLTDRLALRKRVDVLESTLRLIAERRDGLEGIWRMAEDALEGK